MSRLLKQVDFESGLKGLKLRESFKMSNLSFDKHHIGIKWQDGKQSIFPNAFLRSAVRDEKYFNSGTLLYNHDNNLYPLFMANNDNLLISNATPHINSQGPDKDENELKVEWRSNDDVNNIHTSSFNLSWLRSQDDSINNELLLQSRHDNNTNIELWDSSTKNMKYDILYDYNECVNGNYNSSDKLYEIMSNIKKYGIVYFENVPINEESDNGLISLINIIGQIRQRFHPTNVLKISIDKKNEGSIDKDIYTSDTHPWHCDTTYYSGRSPARLSVLLNNVYEPFEAFETYNYFIDSLRIIEDLKKNDCNIYELLKSIPVRLARRRMNVQEECDSNQLPIYYYDSSVNRTLIFNDEKEDDCEALFWSLKHAGIDINALKASLARNNNNVENKIDICKLNETIENFYNGYLYFEKNYLNNGKYRQSIILNSGMCAVFSNYRTVHCRSPVHPNTIRSLSLGFISDDVYYNRWRIINGDKSKLHDKWLYGCQSKQLEILANRFEN